MPCGGVSKKEKSDGLRRRGPVLRLYALCKTLECSSPTDCVLHVRDTPSSLQEIRISIRLFSASNYGLVRLRQIKEKRKKVGQNFMRVRSSLLPVPAFKDFKGDS